MVGGNGNNKIVATLRADGKVYATNDNSLSELANLMNYKIRTESDVGGKSPSTTSATPSVVLDLGKQLLQFARDNDVKGVKNMLARGAPFTSDWLGMSALHFAAMNNQYEICELLLQGGINKDAKTKVDRTPLHLAAYYGNENIVKLLLSKNCAVNGRDMLFMTPLHWAVEKGHKKIVRILLSCNADASLQSKFGKTPIALAVITEQADLLQELEASRQAQINQKSSDKNERETSEAVNSIIRLNDNHTEEVESVQKMDFDTDDDLTNASELSDSKIADLDCIHETGTLDNTTVNLLKSHGISMLQDDDDASKDLLTTALQNGRQLILSEGGKLLLNEAKRVQNNNNNNINNNNNKSLPVRIKPDAISPMQASLGKIRQNLLSKAKDNPSIGRNKNIRIISLNDFKKLYGSTNVKPVQNLPATPNSSIVRQLNNDNVKTDNSTHKVYYNNRLMQNRQKIRVAEDINEDELIEEDMPLANIVQAAPSDSEPEDTLSDTEPLVKQKILSINRTLRNVSTKHDEQQHTSTVQMHAVPAIRPLVPNKQLTNVDTACTAEICRQLFELRKQNEELRRKFDSSQRENEEMRQRLDRLEEYLLVERTRDDDYRES